MTIQAKIISDSISPYNNRLITFQLRYPRMVHSEFMTHRVFSRNASSSRAIPVERLIADVERDPAIPVFWGKNQSGMQARNELSDSEKEQAKTLWNQGLENAINFARQMSNLGAHKQIVNRILEPYAHINVIVTSTEYENFFVLRKHEDAQPEIKALADAMWDARNDSNPTKLDTGNWHLPYVTEDDWAEINGGGLVTQDQSDTMIKISVARCARVSYLTHEGKVPSIQEDIKLYDRLVGSKPLHASPAEHQATPDVICESGDWMYRKEHGNFYGWKQYRKMLPDEYVRG